MASHAPSYAQRFEPEEPEYMPHWCLAMLALTAASWVVTVGAVRLLIAVL